MNSLLMIPKAITPQLLATSTTVFTDLCLYINEARNPVDGSLPPDFPPGLKRLLLVVNLDLAVHHGGLWGYFGDITNDDGSVDEVRDTLDVLRQMNADRIASVLEEAWEVWQEFVAVYRPARNYREHRDFEEFHRSRQIRDGMEIQLDPLDDQYYELQAELADGVGQYARRNTQEFIHPAL